jgi:hypothetical protein
MNKLLIRRRLSLLSTSELEKIIDEESSSYSEEAVAIAGRLLAHRNKNQEKNEQLHEQVHDQILISSIERKWYLFWMTARWIVLVISSLFVIISKLYIFSEEHLAGILKQNIASFIFQQHDYSTSIIISLLAELIHALSVMIMFFLIFVYYNSRKHIKYLLSLIATCNLLILFADDFLINSIQQGSDNADFMLLFFLIYIISLIFSYLLATGFNKWPSSSRS